MARNDVIESQDNKRSRIMKDSFVFRKEWRDAISGFSDDVRLEIYEAIIEYGITGEIRQLKPLAKMAFNFVKTELDKDKQKYEAMCERNKANRNKAIDHSSPLVTTGDQTRPLVTNNDNDSDNDIIKEEPPKGGKKKDELSSSKHTPLELLEKRKQKLYDNLVPFVEKYGKEMVREFYNFWTEPNKSKTKMRFELERTWDLSLRLAYWASRDYEFSKGKKTAVDAAVTTAAAKQREENNADLMNRLDEMKRNSVSYEDARNSEEYKRAMMES